MNRFAIVSFLFCLTAKHLELLLKLFYGSLDSVWDYPRVSRYQKGIIGKVKPTWIYIRQSVITTPLHPFNGPLSGTTLVSRYQKRKTSLDLLEQEIMSGSSISWAICKSASLLRQITMPPPHHPVCYTVELCEMLR